MKYHLRKEQSLHNTHKENRSEKDREKHKVFLFAWMHRLSLKYNSVKFSATKFVVNIACVVEVRGREEHCRKI